MSRSRTAIAEVETGFCVKLSPPACDLGNNPTFGFFVRKSCSVRSHFPKKILKCPQKQETRTRQKSTLPLRENLQLSISGTASSSDKWHYGNQSEYCTRNHRASLGNRCCQVPKNFRQSVRHCNYRAIDT